nr:MAG TPA: repressor domain protein [Caudoviricetes sp.]
MGNNLRVFNYNNSAVRIVQKNGEPWFVLKDVCDVLHLSTPARVAERLEPDEVSSAHVTDGIGRQQVTSIVNESGLYTVILRSDKPEAKPFRKWVTSEVLPSIRKHGAYMTPETLEAAILNPDYLLKVATALKEETDKRKALESKVQADAPKVLFADSVAASTSTILISELAKILRQNGVNTGEKRLFRWMRENGYLVKRNGTDYNMPTQMSMELGILKVKETVVCHSDGHTSISKTPKVTGKGQTYFLNKFLGEGKAV